MDDIVILWSLQLFSEEWFFPRLSRFEWAVGRDAKSMNYPTYMLLCLQPILKGNDGSIVGIEVERGVAGRAVFSPRDEEFAEIIGASVGDALFWALIDELRDCWVSSSEAINTIHNFHQWGSQLIPLIGKERVECIASFASRVAGVPECGSVLTSDEEYDRLSARFRSLRVCQIRQYSPRDISS